MAIEATQKGKVGYTPEIMGYTTTTEEYFQSFMDNVDLTPAQQTPQAAGDGGTTAILEETMVRLKSLMTGGNNVVRRIRRRAQRRGQHASTRKARHHQ